MKTTFTTQASHVALLTLLLPDVNISNTLPSMHGIHTHILLRLSANNGKITMLLSLTVSLTHKHIPGGSDVVKRGALGLDEDFSV